MFSWQVGLVLVGGGVIIIKICQPVWGHDSGQDRCIFEFSDSEDEFEIELRQVRSLII